MFKRSFFSFLFLFPSALLASPLPYDDIVEPPVRSDEWNTDLKVWIGRSCVGEAGFHALDECIAIAWVYSHRVAITGLSLMEVVRRYSAAIKKHSLHRRPWLLELNAELKRPKSWPPNLPWQSYRAQWKALLEALDRWSVGQFANPVPGADHFGSREDAYQAVDKWRWKRLPAPSHFRNWFFDSSLKTTGRRQR